MLDDVMILSTRAFKRSLKWTPRPSHRRGMGQWWGHWAQGTAKSQPRETLERETLLGAQPSAELQDPTVVCSEGELSLKNSHGVACFLWKGYSILLLTTSFQNTDIRKNMVVTFPHHSYWAASSPRRTSVRVQGLLQPTSVWSQMSFLQIFESLVHTQIFFKQKKFCQEIFSSSNY